MTMSSDSDVYDHDEPSDSSIRPKLYSQQSKHLRSSSSMAHSVRGLTTTLKETSRNLNAVDGLLGYYRDGSERKNATIERLRDNLARSTESLRQERSSNKMSLLDVRSDHNSQPLSTSDLQDITSTRKYKPTSPHSHYNIVRGSRRLKGRHERKPSVRFHEDKDEIHDIHETVRDLSDNQIRLEDDLDQEIHQRNHSQITNQRSIQELANNLQNLQRNQEQEKSSHRVDLRLQAIQEELRQHRLHQDAREKKTKPNESLSAELKQAMTSQSKQEDSNIRERLLKAEAEKQQLVMQLETTRRKLDRTKGIKSAMQEQMEEYKSRLQLSDQELSAMQGQLSNLQDTLQQQSVPVKRTDSRQQMQDNSTKDRQHLEQEIETLKLQLSHSQGMKDLDKYQRDLQRSENQRDQLSQHLQETKKELENKENYIAKLVVQLQGTRDSLETNQERHKVLLSQFKELERKLEDGDTSSERQGVRLQELETMLEEVRLKKEDMKRKAKDKIRQWGLKCAKLERGNQSLKERLEQVMDENQQLLKDTESHHYQNDTSSHRMDSLQREINDILEKRAQQDEQLRLKDIEINELKSIRKDLELELRDTRNFMDKLDNELRAHQVRHNVLADEKVRLEQDLASFKSKNQKAEDHIQRLQAEWHKINLEHSELSTQLAEESGGRRVAEAQMRQLMQDMNKAKEDSNRLTQQLKQEKIANKVYIEDMQKDCEEKKNLGDRMILERTNCLKRERAEMDAELQTLKLEVNESRLEVKTLRRELEENNDRVKQVIQTKDQENEKLRHKYERAKAGLHKQAQIAHAENNRASTLERHLESASAQLQEQDIVNQGILQTINKEVDELVECCPVHDVVQRAVFSPTRDVKYKSHHWLADIKSKLQWLQGEMNKRLVHQKQLNEDLEQSRTDIDKMARYDQLQTKLLHSQIMEQEELLNDYKQNNADLMTSARQKEDVMKSLEKQVVQLEHHIHSNVKSLRRSLELSPQPDRLLQNSPSLDYKKTQDLQKERDRINDQYKRYKGTVNLLQHHLEEVKQSTVNQATYSPSAFKVNTLQMNSDPVMNRDRNQDT